MKGKAGGSLGVQGYPPGSHSETLSLKEGEGEGRKGDGGGGEEREREEEKKKIVWGSQVTQWLKAPAVRQDRQRDSTAKTDSVIQPPNAHENLEPETGKHSEAEAATLECTALQK